LAAIGLMEGDVMRIGIIGTGAMARALGARWVGSGHDVVVGGRSPDKAAEVAAAIGARASLAVDAARHAEVVLLAVHHCGVDDVLREAGAAAGTMRGKVLIDCVNSVELEGFTLELPQGASSVAQYVADRTGARVVKAFNLAEAHVWADPPAWATMAPLTVLTATDDNNAADTVAGLIHDLSFRALNVGGLDRARHLETAAALVIELLASGEPSGSVLTWVRPTDIGAGT
jgi:predicted dinucleotide-binding enzyme